MRPTARSAISIGAAGAAAALAFLIVSSGGSPPGGPGVFTQNPVDLVDPLDGTLVERAFRTPEPPYEIEGVRPSFTDDVSYVGERCGTNKVREATGTGPITLTVGGEESIEGSYSAEGSMTLGTFEENFEVRSRSIPMTASYEVPDGEFGHLVVRPLYDVYTYWASGDGAQHVSGTAAVPVGYCHDRTVS